jgi:hypothetical protein
MPIKPKWILHEAGTLTLGFANVPEAVAFIENCSDQLQWRAMWTFRILANDNGATAETRERAVINL